MPEKFGSANLEPIPVHDFLRNVMERHFPEKNERFVLDDSFPSMIVSGDPDKLEIVFVNIFKNSFEAGANRIEVRFRPGGDVGIEVAVEDDGKGCDRRCLQEIGKAFFTTKRSSGGSGLGLCVVKAILLGHGGSLSLYSKNELGDGSTGMLAKIFLPGIIGENRPDDGMSGARSGFMVSAS